MTSFQKIYERSISKFMDYGLAAMSIDIKEARLKQFLLSTAAEAVYAGTKFADYDEDAEVFANTLTNSEIEILAIGVIKNWLLSKTLDTDILSAQYTNSGLKAFSPANQLRELRETYLKIKGDFEGKLKTHSYRNGNIVDLSPGG